MTTDFSKERLLASGFTAKELQKLQNNIDNFGGTFEEVVKDLAKRFKRIFFTVVIMFLLFIYAVFFSSADETIPLGISTLVASTLVTFLQPPVISFKCWRFCRVNKA
ncbi:MAG: Uncharacterized protein H6R25_2756 [Proteobacteria bacterium]|nr:Uncharacterized protein [Pseudomonadota bacterium]